MEFGFSAKHSTETANCFFVEKVKSLLDNGPVVGAVFSDLKNAFDAVNHAVLLSKLSTFNFSQEALKWIESYLLTDLKKRVNNHQSIALSFSTGVPQGSILGSLLFSLYVNDLPSVYSKIEIQIYVDDAVIYVHSNTKSQAASVLTNSTYY